MSNTINRMGIGDLIVSNDLTINGDKTDPVVVGEFTSGATMTVSPETTAESGFITVTISGTDYQIPVYAA